MNINKDPQNMHQILRSSGINVNPAQYLDQCIQFVTRLLDSLFTDRITHDKSDEWVQLFSDTIQLILQANWNSTLTDETRLKIQGKIIIALGGIIFNTKFLITLSSFLTLFSCRFQTGLP